MSMQRHLGITLGLFLCVAALAGCGKSTKPSSPLGMNGANNGATAVDVAQTQDAVAANPALVNEGEYTTNAQMPLLLGAGGNSIIRPVRWWRMIDSTSRTVDIVYSDPDSSGRPTTAVATVHKHFVGTFVIVAGDTGVVTLPDTTLHVVQKPIDDLWTRKLMLKRFRADSSSADTTVRFRWRVVGTSGVDVATNGGSTQILSLRVQAGARDTTITDPLQLHRLRRILWIPEGAPVTVTVTTGRPDDIVVLYHTWERRRFKANGDNTYTITFSDGDFGGLRHFGVNAFSKGTLTDDTAAYDSRAWVLPFGVRDHDCNVDHH